LRITISISPFGRAEAHHAYLVYVTESKRWSPGVRGCRRAANAGVPEFGVVRLKGRAAVTSHAYHGDDSMVGTRKWWWPRCMAHARSTGMPCLMLCAADEDGRPKKRCRLHGSAPGSGHQTPEGKRRAAEALSRTMKSFWSDWKAAGSPPIVRGCVRAGQSKPAPRATPRPPRAQKTNRQGAKMSDAEFLKAIGLKPPE
jgi:hypothetical protein